MKVCHRTNVKMLQIFPCCTNRFPFSWLSSVQSLSRVRLFATPWTAECQASLTITNFQSLLKLMSIESVRSSNHLILCHPLLLLPSIFPSIRVFSSESVLHIRWLKYWSFSFSISSSSEYSVFFFFLVFILFYFLTLQYCIGFAIYQHESATGIHMFPILNSPPSSLLPPSTLPLGRPSVPAPSIQHHASNLDWQLVSYMIFTCFIAILPNLPTLFNKWLYIGVQLINIVVSVSGVQQSDSL